MRTPIHILDESTHRLAGWLADHGQPAFRGRQIWNWLCQRRVEDFGAMTDIPQSLRVALADDYCIWQSFLVKRHVADDGTEKLVLQFPSNAGIECVLIREGHRRTACISSQVGCAMGCVFCASGIDGVQRNLTAGEILEQLLRLQRTLPGDERLSHIVVMGMGEPLANLDAVLSALSHASRSDGLGISARRITISTVGIPQAIDRLIARRVPYRLAISLHAPNDALRDQLVPVNTRIGLREILAAADRYIAATGQRITFEYVLLGGVNDSVEHAEELARLLRNRKALLNVIPYNPVAGLPYQTPGLCEVGRFRQVLERHSINVQFRERKGDAINAACGQLRRMPVLPTSGTIRTSLV
jgi:23S rRNA (adenine2503-C2)-methyltransferase